MIVFLFIGCHLLSLFAFVKIHPYLYVRKDKLISFKKLKIFLFFILSRRYTIEYSCGHLFRNSCRYCYHGFYWAWACFQGHFEPDRAVLFACIAVLGGLFCTFICQ